ncbi:G patch domain and ankyrin repeat-containing protein 1 [Mortierella alpina]|nr:G patch domain and ankyrin repeat-containing protein 1 [Mortierella alpina]
MDRTRNRFISQDDSGPFYRDIPFVPSGTLAMKTAAAAAASSRNREEDAVSVREFYNSVLAMPRTLNKKKRKSHTNTAVRGEQESVSQSTPASDKILTSSPEPSGSSTPITGDTALPTAAKISRAEETSIPAEVIRRNWRSQNRSATPVSGSGSPEPSASRIIAEGYILCEPCQMEVREDDYERHCRGTAHLISQESPIKPLDTLTLGHENKGFRMLVNSGWEYDKGLGVEGQGARHPVATRLKHDRLALGSTGAGKKVVTHTFEEIETSRTKLVEKSNRRVPLNADDYRRKAEKERKDRVKMMHYMKQ